MLTDDDLKKIEGILEHLMSVEEGWFEEQFNIINNRVNDLKKTLQSLEMTLQSIEKRIKNLEP